ncbi:uncharacterized protein LOC142548582 isoform X2 [Primulina tabacum]|uniref:uncharacterized protein LOC142548582 isoform X2 n=1 Tax=Primulina tabacum TaxID=48773 RepID=UPI003F59F926
MGFKTDRRLNDFRHGYVNSFGFSSDLSSPSESVFGSADTVSDEDDYVTGLTHKLAYATLGDSSLSAENTMGWKLSSSPQSTLCSNVTGCECMPGLSCVSHVSVPPDVANAAAWHSLLACVERRARMRLIEETATFNSVTPTFARSRKPDTTDLSHGAGFYPNQSHVPYQQLQAAQFQQLKQQLQPGSYWEQEKIAHQQMVRNVKKNEGSGNPSMSMESWPDIQLCQPRRQRSSGMKAVFLGKTETKSKRTGTGVFLPRNLGATPVETRKKTGCPVLLPDRVVQALNLNLKSMDLQSLATRTDFLATKAALKHVNRVSTAEQRRTLRPVPPAKMDQESELPRDWTY